MDLSSFSFTMHHTSSNKSLASIAPKYPLYSEMDHHPYLKKSTIMTYLHHKVCLKIYIKLHHQLHYCNNIKKSNNCQILRLMIKFQMYLDKTIVCQLPYRLITSHNPLFSMSHSCLATFLATRPSQVLMTSQPLTPLGN